MIDGIRIGNLMVDCADAQALQTFYAGLLGWDTCEAYALPGVRGPAGALFLFAQEADYVPPVWPEKPGYPQKQLHLDFQVPDVAAAVREALRLGAREAEAQFGGADFVTLLDPAGHPFCLCAADNEP